MFAPVPLFVDRVDRTTHRLHTFYLMDFVVCGHRCVICRVDPMACDVAYLFGVSKDRFAAGGVITTHVNVCARTFSYVI
jgi:hypothetical protein